MDFEDQWFWVDTKLLNTFMTTTAPGTNLSEQMSNLEFWDLMELRSLITMLNKPLVMVVHELELQSRA